MTDVIVAVDIVAVALTVTTLDLDLELMVFRQKGQPNSSRPQRLLCWPARPRPFAYARNREDGAETRASASSRQLSELAVLMLRLIMILIARASATYSRPWLEVLPVIA
jgi:hypothetical protein